MFLASTSAQLSFGDFTEFPSLLALLTAPCDIVHGPVCFYNHSRAAAILREANSASNVNGLSDVVGDTVVETAVSNNSSEILSNGNILVSNSISKPTGWAALFPSSNAPVYEMALVNSELSNSTRAALRHCLQSLVVDHQANVPTPPRGLYNRANCCYVNSVVQMLLFCPPFFSLLQQVARVTKNVSLRALPPALAALVELHREQTSRSDTDTELTGNYDELDAAISAAAALDPLPILRWLEHSKGHSFSLGVQEDAEEFLSFLLLAVHEELLHFTDNNVVDKDATVNQVMDEGWAQVGKQSRAVVLHQHGSLGISVISKLFGGQLRSVLRNTSGKQQRDALQPFFVLPLSIEHYDSVVQALHIWNQLEHMDSQGPQKQLFLECTPPLLVLQLKCFLFDESFHPKKLLKRLDIPQRLELPINVLSSSMRAQLPIEQRRYQLYGVVHHWGADLARGHYTSSVFHTTLRRWLLFDDRTVRLMSLHEVLACREDRGRMPYLLLYRRLDTIQ